MPIKRKRLPPAQLRILGAVAKRERAGQCFWHYASRYELRLMYKLLDRGYMERSDRSDLPLLITAKGWECLRSTTPSRPASAPAETSRF